MKVCVLIGNGFDLALGLKTGYRDFIVEYLANNKESGNPDGKWLCEAISADIDTWGDAEIAFGELPFGQAGKDAVATYMACEESFSVSFHQYLRRENSRFCVPIEEQKETRTQFLQCLLDLAKWMTSGHREKCRLVNGADITVHFIDFNYTDTVKQILGLGSSTVKTSDGMLSEVKVETICQVHGMLDSGVLFGVDAAEQIADAKVRGYCSRTGETIKPRGAEVAGYAERVAGVELLRAADVIVTFGLSFGKSDRSWWQLLWERIFDGGRHAQLIVCPYSSRRPIDILGNRMVRNYASEKKKVFRSFSGENEIANLEAATADRIIVLQPMTATEEPYDYFRLAALKRKYTKGADS